MIDRIKLFLNCDEELQSKIKIFIEYFVRYYGEDRRKEIEEKLSKAVYIGYMTPKNQSRIIRKLKEEKSKQLQQIIAEKNMLSLTAEDLFDKKSFDNMILIPMYRLIKLKELHDKGKIQRAREFIDEGYEFTSKYFKDMTKIKYLSLKSVDQLPRELPSIIKNNIEYYLDKSNVDRDYKNAFENALPLLRKIDPKISIDKLRDFFKDDRVKHLIVMYEEAIKQYELFLEEEKEIISREKRNEKLEQVLKDKYYLLYLKDNIDLIPENERKPIYDYLDGKTNCLFANSYINNILGFSLTSTSLLEYFDEEYDDVIKEGKQEWRINTIKENRIKYFKTLGIDLGDSYDVYETNQECLAKWPSKKLIQRVIDSKNTYHNKFNNEYFEGINEFKNVRERIEAQDLLDKNDWFNAKLLTDSSTFVSPNIRMTDEGYDIYSLLVINFDNLDTDVLDHHIVHELNHLFEVALTKVNGKKYETIVGWDYGTGEIEQEREKEVDTINIDREKRDYELFNEIINELIAQEICELMHNDNVTVFDVPGESRYKRTTSYEDYLVLVQDFYHEFKDKIIESRKNGNFDAIFNEIGEENFNELNNLIKYFYKNFEGMKIYSLRGSLKKKEDNEMTRIYFEIIEKRNEILEKMRNYKKENTITI